MEISIPDLLKNLEEKITYWKTNISIGKGEDVVDELYQSLDVLSTNHFYGEVIKIIKILVSAEQVDLSIDWDKIISIINKQLLSVPKSDREMLFPIYIILGEKAVTPLLELLKDVEAKDLRYQIITILKEIFGKDKEAFVKLLETVNEPWFLVRNIVFIAGELGDENIVPYLEKFIAYNNIKVKKETAEALIKLKGINSAQYIVKFINEKDPVIRYNIVELLLRYQIWSLLIAENLLFTFRSCFDKVGVEEVEKYIRGCITYLSTTIPHLHNPERVIKGFIPILKTYGKKNLLSMKKSKTQIRLIKRLLESLFGVESEKIAPYIDELISSTQNKEFLEVLNSIKSKG